MNIFSCCSQYILPVVTGGALLLGCFGACIAPQRSVPRPGHEAVYKYGAPGTRLEGTLIRRRVYGPPGYGETPGRDLRANILVLKLRQPITVEPVPPVARDNPNGDTFRHVREVQLFVSTTDEARALRLLGRTVVVEGILNEHIAPSQYTDVWLDTKALKLK